MPGCFWRVLVSQLLGIRAFRWRSRRRNAFKLLLREVMCILFITSFTHFIPIPSYIHFLLIPLFIHSLQYLLYTFSSHVFNTVSHNIYFPYILSQYPFYAFSPITFFPTLGNSCIARELTAVLAPHLSVPSRSPKTIASRHFYDDRLETYIAATPPLSLVFASVARGNSHSNLFHFEKKRKKKKNNRRVVRRQGKGGFMNDECANQLTE